MERSYVAIDLKSFYASVECVERGLDPLGVNLVVADPTRTDKTICLAVSPSLKAYGIPGRPRLFEVRQKVDEINRLRLRQASEASVLAKSHDGSFEFSGSSYDAGELSRNKALSLSFITAQPRMRLYEKYSTWIYSIYLRYISPEDIHVYSIDEVFMDVTRYLETYKMSPRELAMTMIKEVLRETGITATAGIGSNLYLAKVSMDIVAKHLPADENGVRIAELNEHSYREQLWRHRPLTDFWRVGRGYAGKLEAMGLFTMGDIARASLFPQKKALLYKTFGVNAELLIDHAWGVEPVTIELIRAYRPSSNSISSGQVLKEPYVYEKAALVVREMTELMVQELVRKHLVTKQLVLNVSYDRESIKLIIPGRKMSDGIYTVASTGKIYKGKVAPDMYGRPHPSHAHGTANLELYTSSPRRIVRAVMELFVRIIDPDLLVRRINISACGLINENDIPPEAPRQLCFFEDMYSRDNLIRQERRRDEKERNVLRAIIGLQNRFGRNIVLRGMNFIKGGTTIERNGQIGGHRA